VTHQKEYKVNTTTPTQQLSWLIECAEIKRKDSQFATFQTILQEIEQELYQVETELDDQMYCEVAYYLARSYEDLGYVGKAQELFEQASLFAPEFAHLEVKALIREVRLKSLLKQTEDLESSYIYLRSMNLDENFDWLCTIGFAEVSFGRIKDSLPYFERALNLKSASDEEKKKLYFELIEQELFHGHNFSKLIKLSDLGVFKTISCYEQTLVFALSQDNQALGFLGPAWFARMNPVECLKAAYLLSNVKTFTLGWSYRPIFFQNLSQYDFQTQMIWKKFFAVAA
jgi:tetratricopeptide (TPR) repeat protein